MLHRAGKQGLAAAYVAGFRWGLERGYDVLVEMDADGSHQPQFRLKHGTPCAAADMVKGSRWMPGGEVVDYDKSEWPSRLANIWVQASMAIPVGDTTGGFNAFPGLRTRKMNLDTIASKDTPSRSTPPVACLTTVDRAGGAHQLPRPRRRGVLKMCGSIIGEALLRTTCSGVPSVGSAQVAQFAREAADRVEPLVDRVKDKLD